jgi:hypothetical protein
MCAAGGMVGIQIVIVVTDITGSEFALAVQSAHGSDRLRHAFQTARETGVLGVIRCTICLVRRKGRMSGERDIERGV